jgi:hypothetical protein
VKFSCCYPILSRILFLVVSYNGAGSKWCPHLRKPHHFCIVLGQWNRYWLLNRGNQTSIPWCLTVWGPKWFFLYLTLSYVFCTQRWSEGDTASWKSLINPSSLASRLLLSPAPPK